MELRGDTLYVVRNFLNQVAAFGLGAQLKSADLLDVITSPNLDIPTTTAFQAGALWTVNARFSTPPTPDTEYQIVRLPATAIGGSKLGARPRSSVDRARPS